MEVLDSLLSSVRRCCEGFPDKRRGTNSHYTMADIGLAAFSVFFTQSPSFLNHQRQLETGHGRSNCQTLFGIARIPSDNHIRDMLDPVAPDHLFPAFGEAVARLERSGGIAAFRRLGSHVLIALDGTESMFEMNKHLAQHLKYRQGVAPDLTRMRGALWRSVRTTSGPAPRIRRAAVCVQRQAGTRSGRDTRNTACPYRMPPAEAELGVAGSPSGHRHIDSRNCIRVTHLNRGAAISPGAAVTAGALGGCSRVFADGKAGPAWDRATCRGAMRRSGLRWRGVPAPLTSLRTSSSRSALPSTELRLTSPPSSAAIWLALKPSRQSLVSSSIRSSVHVWPTFAIAASKRNPSSTRTADRPAAVIVGSHCVKVAPRRIGYDEVQDGLSLCKSDRALRIGRQKRKCCEVELIAASSPPVSKGSIQR